MKLISMTDFVIKQCPEVRDSIITANAYINSLKYALFLKQDLTLSMFVPCDGNGNFIQNPQGEFNYLKGSFGEELNMEYQKAKDKVLFKGWEYLNSKEVFFKSKDGGVYMLDFDSGYTVEDFTENEEESRYLTESAIKQIS